MSATPRPRGRATEALRDGAAGLVAGTLMAVLSVSIASLIFSGALAPFRAQGIALALAGTLVAGAVVALRSGWRGAVAHVQDTPAVAVAVAAASLASTAGGGAAAFASVLAFVALTTIATGTIMVAIGTARLARLVRYLPYPVVGGFLAGTGWLLVTGAIGMMSALRVELATVPALLEPPSLLRWGPGLAFAVVAVVLSRTVRHPLTFPLLVLAATALFYLVATVAGDLGGWRAAGLLLGPFPEGGGGRFPPFVALQVVDTAGLSTHAGTAMAAVLLALLGLLFNATGIEHAGGGAVDLDRELQTAGIANVLAGTFGSPTAYHGLSFTILNQRIAAHGRIGAVLALAVVAVTLLLGPRLLEFVPTAVVGGVLATVGLLLLVEWLGASFASLPRLEYAVVVAIAVTIAGVGFLPGIAVGLALAVVLFVSTYARIDAVRHMVSGSEAYSRVTWTAAERARLVEHGERVLILQLQGYLFFGTAHALVERIERRLESRPTLAHLILDFTHVTGMDATAATSFGRIQRLVRRSGGSVAASAMSPALASRLERGGLLTDCARFASLEDALAAWEAFVLSDGPDSGSTEVDDPFAEGGDALVRALQRLPRRSVAAGAHVVSQGDAPDALFLVIAGRVSAVLHRPGVEAIRLETMGPGALVGEVGFYTGATRSASVVADVPTTLTVVTDDDLVRLSEEAPEAAAALHRFVARRLAARAAHLLRAVAALER
jgi:sulfate permease, SulP family